jgi:hypothetical protein
VNLERLPEKTKIFLAQLFLLLHNSSVIPKASKRAMRWRFLLFAMETMMKSAAIDSKPTYSWNLLNVTPCMNVFI